MKSTFKILSKLALLAVVFGFFQPIACSMNGFELAKQLIRHETVKTTISAITLYVCFITVILSILFTLSLLLSRKKNNYSFIQHYWLDLSYYLYLLWYLECVVLIVRIWQRLYWKGVLHYFNRIRSLFYLFVNQQFDTS